MSEHFLPNKFKVSINLVTDEFYICPLSRSIADLDYEAVMSSQKELQGIFGQDSEWPKSNMTLQENVCSIKIHEDEFETEKAFAYSVLNHAKDKCFGSIYIDPSRSKNFDCEVHFWMRSDRSELEEQLFETVVDWMQNHWPVEKVAYPGRSISWEHWEKQLKIK